MSTPCATASPSHEARLTGGVSRNPAFAQMFADVLGMPVTVTDTDEAAAWGAALCAGAAVGLYASPQDDPRDLAARARVYDARSGPPRRLRRPLRAAPAHRRRDGPALARDRSPRRDGMTAVRDVDVVILGAGVNGAGLFRDLCEQGVTCLIVDKADFGSGTSAAPSRLIHGGLKYLETGEFGLVAQSTLERNLLLKNAPHCVEPLPTVIPIFSWTKGVGAALRTLLGSTTAPRSRGAVLIKIGLALYDFYGARDRVMPRHRLVGKRRALRETPHLTPRHRRRRHLLRRARSAAPSASSTNSSATASTPTRPRSPPTPRR